MVAVSASLRHSNHVRLLGQRVVINYMLFTHHFVLACRAEDPIFLIVEVDDSCRLGTAAAAAAAADCNTLRDEDADQVRQ